MPDAFGIPLDYEQGENLLYREDLQPEVNKALYLAQPEFSEADTLVLDSTYFEEHHIPRKEIEEKIILISPKILGRKEALP